MYCTFRAEYAVDDVTDVCYFKIAMGNHLR